MSRPALRWFSAAILLALLALWIARDDPAPPPSQPLQPRIATPTRVVRDGTVAITVDEDGAVQSVSTPREEWNALLAAALRDGRIPRYDAKALTATGAAPRGDDQRPAVELQQPVGTVVESDRPFFRWSGPEESMYRIVIARDGVTVATSEPQSGRMWIPHEPLERGAIYSWQVMATIDATESAFPAPDRPPARFLVLGANEFAELEAARKTRSNLLTSLVATRLGLTDITAEELDRMLSRQRPAPTTTNPAQ